jgi:FdhD protein
MQTSVSTVSIVRFSSGTAEEAADLLATEEPMEIRLVFGPKEDRRKKNISVTLRTPGNDFELAIGFLFTEGILPSFTDVSSIRYCTEGGTRPENKNIVQVELAAGIIPELSGTERNFYATSSCGICGKASIEAVRTLCKTFAEQPNFQIASSLLLELPARLRKDQPVFKHTGGLHAAALFDTDGKQLFLREDIGRHNAVDKLIGAGVAGGGIPFSRHILLLSGRAGFELIQKAAMAGIRMVAAIGAPSSLAVSLAKEHDITLVGFLREGRFNCYAGADRIIP